MKQTNSRKLFGRGVVMAVAAGLLLAAGTGSAPAATLTNTTDLVNGTPIPTDAGSFDETDNTAPYVYNIDDDPGTVTLQNRVAFDMGAYNLNNTGANTHDVTINAASLSYSGVGGAFGFSAASARPDLTIDVTGSLAIRSATTYANVAGNVSGGAITLIAPNGIAVLNGLESMSGANNGGNGGAITLTSTGGTASIQIGGIINTRVTRAGGGSGGAVALTAANGIALSNQINTSSVSVNGGAININGGTGPVSIAGSITANGNTDTKDGNLSITSGDTITLSSQLNLELINTLTLTAPNVFLNGGVSGNESLTKTGTGIWTIAGTSTYTGGTTINAGTLALSGSGTLGATTGNVLVNGSSAILNLGTLTRTNATITLGAGLITNGTLAATTAFSVTNGTVAAILANGSGTPATLTKSGGGTLTLSGANTYSGATLVSAGTLALTGSGTAGTGAIRVNAGATFDVSGRTGGTYTLGGGTSLTNNGTMLGWLILDSGTELGGTGVVSSASLNSGSTLNPGNSPGTITVSNLNFSGGTFFAELVSSNSHDQIDIVGGGGAITNASLLRLALAIADMTPGTEYLLVHNTTLQSWTTGDYFTLSDWDDGFDGDVNGAVILTNGVKFWANGGTGSHSNQLVFAVGYIDVDEGGSGPKNDIVLTVVPEPGTVGMIGLIGFAGYFRRRLRG